MPSHAVGRHSCQCLPTGTARALAAGAHIKTARWSFDFERLRNAHLAPVKEGRAVTAAPRARVFFPCSRQRATPTLLPVHHAEATNRDNRFKLENLHLESNFLKTFLHPIPSCPFPASAPDSAELGGPWAALPRRQQYCFIHLLWDQESLSPPSPAQEWGEECPGIPCTTEPISRSLQPGKQISSNS